MGGIGNYTDPEKESYCRDIRREQTPKADKITEEKKQYHIQEYSSFRDIISVFNNGTQIYSVMKWKDEVDKYIEDLEKDNYIRGYSIKEVEEAEKKAKYLRKNMIEEVK